MTAEAGGIGVVFEVVSFESALAIELIAELQGEYVARYGQGDGTPLDAGEFNPPDGVFLVGYLREPPGSRQPVACAGVRMSAPGLAELKRMYVRPAARRRGIARRLLAAAETEAARLGAQLLRLETGLRQPEAIALYESAGYTPTEPFGHYAGEALARHFAKRLTGDARRA